jgi:hypothetical protein
LEFLLLADFLFKLLEITVLPGIYTVQRQEDMSKVIGILFLRESFLVSLIEPVLIILQEVLIHVKAQIRHVFVRVLYVVFMHIKMKQIVKVIGVLLSMALGELVVVVKEHVTLTAPLPVRLELEIQITV